MKKLFITAAIATMFSVTAFADGGKKAAPAAGEENVSYAVLSQFKTDYANATNVVWTEGSGADKVTFTDKNVTFTAFYDIRTGEFWGVSQQVDKATLSASAKNKIARSYKDYTISDVTKFEPQDGEEQVVYFVNVKNATSELVLTMTPDGEVKNVEKV